MQSWDSRPTTMTARMSTILFTVRELQKRGMTLAQAKQATAVQMGIDSREVDRVVESFLPTTDIAREYLKARSFRLAVRAVRKANVDQALDILSRPNIGVLAPQAEGGSGGAGGFFLSVSAETCGAVKVTAAAIHQGASDPIGL